MGGSNRIVVEAGQRFGLLVVLSVVRREHNGKMREIVRLRCDCGNLCTSQGRYLCPGTNGRKPRRSCGLQCGLRPGPAVPRREHVKIASVCNVCRQALDERKSGGRPAAFCSHECRLQFRRDMRSGRTQDPDYFTTRPGVGITAAGNIRIGVAAVPIVGGDPQDGEVRYLVVTRDEESEHDTFEEAACEYRLRSAA